MKFRLRGKMQSCPAVKFDAKLAPLDFDASVSGALQGKLGPFSVDIGEIPVRLAIPFLKRRALPVVASVGGLHVGLDSFRIDVENATVNLKGTLGLKGIEAKVDSKIDCETHMAVDGQASGHIGLSHLDLGEESPNEEEGAEK